MNTKFFIYLNLGVAGLQIVAFIMTGSWLNAGVFIFNYAVAWKMIKQYKREKAKEWYANILAAQDRARFPQHMKNCLGLCNSTDDYLPIAQILFSPPLTSKFTGQLICRLCGRVE